MTRCRWVCLHTVLYLGGLTFAGCVGRIADPGPSPPGPASQATPDPGEEPPGPGGQGTAQLPPFSPGPNGMPRLSPREFRNGLVDLFGGGVPLPEGLDTIPRVSRSTAIGAGSAAWSDSGTVKQLAEAALSVASWIWKDARRRQSLGICVPASKDDGCIRESLATWGQRLWRRPLAPAELADLVARVGALAAELGGVDRAFATTFALLVASPHHVYRVELGEPDPARPGWLRLSDWELASRLSFGLWESTPDPTLLEMARAGGLRSREAIAAAAERMLRDPRSERGFQYLFSDTYQDVDLEAIDHDHPSWTPVLRSAMREELRRMVVPILAGDRDYRELLTGRTTFVNAGLARFYGISAPGATDDLFVPARLPPDRGGILTTAALLALYGADGSSPIFRGRFVRSDLLCQPISEPPDDLAEAIAAQRAAKATDGTVTPTRYAAQQRLNTAPCNACHQLIDPIGLGFEKFDVVGAPQAMEGGVPTTGHGWLDDQPTHAGQAFDGPTELAELLAASPRFADCVVRGAYARLVRRPLADGEEVLVHALGRQFQASGYRYRGLLAAVVSSDGFRQARVLAP